jgi:hypothetical protein
MMNNVENKKFIARSSMLAWAGIALGGILMILSARGDLWLDEIWSIFFAEAARSPWEILTRFKHDNNHVLNTLYLYAIGKQQDLMLYRGLAIASGIGSLILLRKIASRWGAVESAIVVLLAATSYPLLLYFSEARGYAPAIFFGLLSFFLLRECQCTFRPALLILFWCASILGALSHLSFMIVFLSLVIFTLHHELNGDAPLVRRFVQVGIYLMVPGVTITAFYLTYARGMTIGGGPPVDKFIVLQQGIASFAGLPDGLRALGIPLAFLPVLWSLASLYRAGDEEWSFYVSVLLAAPALAIIFAGEQYFNYRYIIVCFPFAYLLLARLLTIASRAEARFFRYLAFIVLDLFVVGQVFHLAPFFEYGRGSYKPIIAEMESATAGTTITVGSDNDFRNKMVLLFYERFFPGGKEVRYVDQSSWSDTPPEWLIVHSLDESVDPEPWVAAENGQIYRLAKAERFSGNSGFSWFLYHNSNR